MTHLNARYANDADYLMGYIANPEVSQQDRGALMNAYGEVNTRLTVMRGMDMPADGGLPML